MGVGAEHDEAEALERVRGAVRGDMTVDEAHWAENVNRMSVMLEVEATLNQPPAPCARGKDPDRQGVEKPVSRGASSVTQC